MKHKTVGVCVVHSVLALWFWALPSAAAAQPACPALLQQTLPRLQDEKPIPLCNFAGKVVVVVNTASKCGYTPQYKSLETLSERYKARGLVVLGFPSNDFGGQEPGNNAAIADFCENTFAVKFPMFTKTTVKAGPGTPVNPLFVALATRTGKAPQWNFHKYIVSRQGDVVISHGSDTDPLDPAFLKDVDKLLNSK
jgi:glutathione peroxidase